MLGFALATLSVLGSVEPVGPLEQRKLTAHVHELLVKRDFAGVQREVDGLLAARAVTVDGRRLLEVVVGGIRAQRDIWEPIKAWTSLPQAGHSAFLFEGAYFVTEAWRARGIGYGHTVSEHGSEQFEQSLKLARAALEKAWRMQPRDPTAPALLITVAMGLGSPEQEMETWFGRAVEADPLDYGAYATKLTYLLPKWYGSEAKSAAFADQCDQKGPAGGRAYTIKILRYWELAWWSKDEQARRAFLETPSIRADVDRLLGRWLKDFPRSPEAHFIAARMALSRLDETAGRASLDRALALSPDYPAALLESAKWRTRTKDHVGAAKELERLVELDPDNSQVFMWLGYNAEARGLDTALGYYDKAVSLDPTAADAWVARGRVRFEKGLQAQGSADFERAIAIDGSSASPYYQRAIANQRQSRFEEAQRDYQQAIRLADGLSGAELQYARQMLRGLESKARIHYQRAIESHKQSRLEEAKADYREAIRVADGLSDAELKYARETLASLDSQARFYYQRGYDYHKQGRYKRAKADYEEAIRLADGLSASELQNARNNLRALDNVARFYYDRAEKHYRYGRLQEAREDYEEAVRLVAGLTPVELEHARDRVRSIAPEEDN